jgi:DUF4097 and DUF4098 domain-containing protein YvlB
MKHWIQVSGVLLALGTLPALAAEATFERTLSVSGTTTLHISTGSGYIHLKPGSDSQIHIYGHVKSGWGGSEDRVREVAAHPPIEQTGSIVRVGGNMENMHNISIDYDVEAPAKTLLDASSGSGDITDVNVGVNARLNTGSGSIHATGLKDSFAVETGSGDIYAEQVGAGDVKAHTGSGEIELKNLAGGLKAETGSGDIKLGGQPKADWRISTGSGTVELWADRSAFTLDASTGSGEIKTDREMVVQGSLEKHHISGKINGGGPMVRVSTGSGDIRVH